MLTNECLTFDFGRIEWAYPFATLLLAQEIKHIVRIRRRSNLKTKHRGAKSAGAARDYLGHIGFFRFIGAERGSGHQPEGSSRYLPLTPIRVDLTGGTDALYEEIERKSEHLAEMVFPGDEAISEAAMLEYCFREAIRNVFEHANIDECIIMAQKYNDEHVEIGISDRGCGIYRSLSSTFPNIQDGTNALLEASKPGTSRMQTADIDRGRWSNSGFGLYVLSQLGEHQGGEFILASADDSLRITKGGQWLSKLDVPMDGTAIKLNYKTANAAQFSSILPSIVAKGEKELSLTTASRDYASKRLKSEDTSSDH